MIGSDGYAKDAKRSDQSSLDNTVLALDTLQICKTLGATQNTDSLKTIFAALVQTAKNIQPVSVDAYNTFFLIWWRDREAGLFGI